ncbi:PilZ domain-containing protein [bacterium]|nr:PilZ domain-containing protein [bacterium]
MATTQKSGGAKDRRRAVRAIAFFRTEVRYKKKYYVGYIVNISLVGCAFAHENLTDIDEGGDCRLKFRMNGKIVNTKVVVRWRDTTIMGLQFVSITPIQKKLLHDYIRTVTIRRIPI